MSGLDLLPALGRAVGRCWVVPGAGPAGATPVPCRGPPPVPAVGRVAPSRDRSALPTGSVAPRDSAPPTCRRAHREREQAQDTLGTADHDTRAVEAGANRVPRSTGR